MQMAIFQPIRSSLSVIKKYRYRLVITIAVAWTLIDSLYMLTKHYIFKAISDYMFFEYREIKTLLLREVLVFITSYAMAYLLVFRHKKISGSLPMWLSFLIKTI